MSAVPAPVARELSKAKFENVFVGQFPGDPSTVNVPRQVRNALYTRVEPTPVKEPRLLAWSEALAESLGLARPDAAGVEVLAGNRVLSSMQPYAARYGGHQFGHWAGQLGDGRAITLGEMIARDGSRQELQLKGAGRTPYSRTADGRAVLRSSLREYLCSEAMHALGVPTTRALALVGTGEDVIRDMFYDGHAAPEPGAVVCRVAPSFLRLGNFQILAANEEIENLRALCSFTWTNFYTNVKDENLWFQELCRRTALLMVDWMRLGFVHGVMNTDNLSALGLTIDYGPYGWLEGYDPAWTPNTTDAEGRRYAYGNQPYIGLWNLARLGEALLPVYGKEILEEGLKNYGLVYQDAMQKALAQKLGLDALDDELSDELFKMLAAVETDFTIFFRKLADVDKPDAGVFKDAFYAEPDRERVEAWLKKYLERAKDPNRKEKMNRVNPKYVPRNYLAQQAIDAMAQGDATVLERLMRVLSRPYEEQPGEDDLAARRPEWARHKAGCSALSCSS